MIRSRWALWAAGAFAGLGGLIAAILLWGNRGDGNPRSFAGIHEVGFEYANFMRCADGATYWLEWDKAVAIPSEITAGGGDGRAPRKSFYMEFDGEVADEPGASYGHLGQWGAAVTVTRLHEFRQAGECP